AVKCAVLPLAAHEPLRRPARRSAGTYDAPSSIVSTGNWPRTPLGPLISTVPARGTASTGETPAAAAQKMRIAARTRMVSVSSEVSAILSKGEPNHELKGGRSSRNRPAVFGGLSPTLGRHFFRGQHARPRR